MADWSAAQYLKFEDERTRSARDLLAQVHADVREAIDLGCGPGNSTELLTQRWPQAKVSGVDSSPDMLRQARERLPGVSFAEADLTTWSPARPVDLMFANAVFQWVPDHVRHFTRLADGLNKGGVLAVQMPDNLREPSHALMRETARAMPFADKLLEAVQLRDVLPPVATYYDALVTAYTRVDIWHVVYNFRMDGAAAIVEWVKGTGLRPFVNPLDENERATFLADYTRRLEAAYPARADGKILLRFPRMFIVATR